jgi:F0F1-type ATP synthase delta subunit
VGLTNAQIKDFAALLAQASNTADVQTKMASYLEDKEKTKTVKLNQVVPVELRYETIVLEDGKLHIYRDVYAQDTNTEDNLRRVLEANGLKLEDLPEQQRTQILNALNSKPKKEVVIDLGTVAQKGYPAPVDLDTGNGKKNTDKRGSKNTD